MSTVKTTYDQDFYAWLMQNAELVRQGRWSDIDAEHIAEELETMGRSEKRQLINRLAVLLAHLLKWQYQPAHRSPSWRNTIAEQREAVSELLEDSPSLTHELEAKLDRAYRKALYHAERETGLPQDRFPAECPYPLAQALDSTFWPE